MSEFSETPATDQVDPVIARFASDLRRLRLDAGSPTLARLQHETGISRTVLSEAFAGRRIPSERTVDAIARACGSDPEPWLERRAALIEGSRPVADATAAQAPARRASRWRSAWIGIAGFTAGVTASAIVAAVIVAPWAPSSAAAQIAVASGTDPAQTACLDDARVATGDTRVDNSLLEIVWSDKCQAGWGRITRYDGLYQGNMVTIAIYPQTAPTGPDRQEATEHDVQGAYTTLVVRPSPDTLLCAEGSFTVDGTRIDLGDPLCI